MGTTYKHAVQFIGSWVFFAGIVIIFVIQSAWIAISSRFPMAFDEAYHLGLIKIQARQLSPIITHQPPGPATYGALTRDPSYLYHWLMSFPYRLVSHTMTSFMGQVITLRLINVALFAGGLVLFRIVLNKTKASPALINATLLFFVLTPVVTLLAAHINYDNLLVPCVALSCLLTLRVREQLLTNRQLSSRSLLALGTLCCLASLVKYPFLPIFAAIFVYLLFLSWSVTQRKPGLSLLKSWQRNWDQVVSWQKIVFVISFVVSVGLFSYTYGSNLWLYHNPIPQCGQVLGVVRCQAYGPWVRNYQAAQHVVNAPDIFYFVPNWFGGMFERLLFVINGPSGPAPYQNYLAPILAGVAAIGGLVGLGLFFKHGRPQLEHDRVLAILLFISLVYLVALWGRNFHDYVHLGELVAINGRYLVPVILPWYLAAARGWQQGLTSTKHLVLVFMIALLLCLQGGGIVSYAVYSNQSWYWPKDAWILTANRHLQRLIKPLVWTPKLH